MKMAIDYWYELWENSRNNKDGLSLERTQHSEEEGRHNQWEENYKAWVSAKAADSDSY
jgi:hypothetical protein